MQLSPLIRTTMTNHPYYQSSLEYWTNYYNTLNNLKAEVGSTRWSKQEVDKLAKSQADYDFRSTQKQETRLLLNDSVSCTEHDGSLGLVFRIGSYDNRQELIEKIDTLQAELDTALKALKALQL